MTADEVVDLLTLMASYDRRTVGKADVAAWQQVVGDLPFGDCEQAVIAHYRDSTDWLMPAHVRQRVKAMRADRVARSVPAAPGPELADQPGRYAAAIREGVRRLADGFRPPRELPGPLPGDPPQVWQDVKAELAPPPRTPQEIAAAQVAEARAARAAEGGES